ncbi:MAG: hypothetical protein JW870_14220 [Candidatus Delongbacteria bacterium]|nr:hypothetical protein [Candidatus Delongbacteria bacterium]
MTTGRQNKLVGQTGEYLVAAELSRRGLIATTFTGNVPHYDIIASSEEGKHVSVQVKTISGINWQFSRVDQFVEIEFKDHMQVVGKCLQSPIENLVFVFVKLEEYGTDKFYICTWSELTDILSKAHSEYLAKHNGVRPKKWDSLHISINENHISHFENRWELVEKMLQ